MKSNLLSSFCSFAVVAGAVLAPAFFASSAHAGPVLPEVGPTPPGHYDKVTCGYLQVFSRTDDVTWGEDSHYFVHSAYWIYDAAGNKIKTVSNHDTSIDESPSKVRLAPGKYIVRAWSDNDGLVTVPVIVKLAQTTKVNLEDSRDNQAIDNSSAVKTPSGQVVGWKA